MFKSSVSIPSGINWLNEDNSFFMKTSQANVKIAVPALVKVVLSGEQLNLSSRSKMMLKTALALIRNAIIGLTEGYTVEIELSGTGYEFKMNGNELTFKVGYSHPVTVMIPNGIKCIVSGSKRFTLNSANKELLGSFAKRIEEVKYPAIYTGSGVKIVDKLYLRKKVVKV